MEEIPMGDGDSWLETMMTINPSLALRIMETRRAYTTEFDWLQLKKLVEEDIAAANVKLMRKHAEVSSRAVLTDTEQQ
jgi:hypothetical protein